MTSVPRISEWLRASLLSFFHLAAAAASYHLVTGGWLRTHYQWGDADIVNLLLPLFELVALFSVAAYWLRRTRLSYRILSFIFALRSSLSPW